MSSDVYKRTLFVKNLAQASDEAILNLFSPFGNFTHKVVSTSDTNRKDVFVEFESEENATKARAATHGQVVDGNYLFVDFAQNNQLSIFTSLSNQQAKTKTSVFDRIIKPTDPNYPKNDDKNTPTDKQPSDKDKVGSEKGQPSSSQKTKIDGDKSSSESNAKKSTASDKSETKKSMDSYSINGPKKLEITKPKKENAVVAKEIQLAPSKPQMDPIVGRLDLNYPLHSSDERHYSHSKTKTDSRSRSRTREKSHSRNVGELPRSASRRSRSSSRNRRSTARKSRSRSADRHREREPRSSSRHQDIHRSHSRRSGSRERRRSRSRSFHIIGTVMDRVWRDGDVLSPPAQNIQTTLVPCGGAAVVDFKARIPGTYTLVDHALNRIQKGCVGFLDVEGEDRPDIFHSAEPPKICKGCSTHK